VQYEEFGEETPETQYQVYLPSAVLAYRGMAMLVRTTGDPAALEAPIRAALRELSPTFAAYQAMAFDDRRYLTQWESFFFGRSFGLFGGLALLLALAGVYGVTAYSVARRRHEIGVRIALGSTPRAAVALVLRRAIRIATAGILIGSAVACVLAPLLRSTMYDMRTTDLVGFVWLPLALLAASLFASWLPARSAARVDPMTALRAE
jgi:ABC-type antimicrobial peptide transport system permease subunit